MCVGNIAIEQVMTLVFIGDFPTVDAMTLFVLFELCVTNVISLY